MRRELAAKVAPEAFEARYAAATDPWSFENSLYETNRYAALLQALSRPHYEVIYEPGCSIGVLTAKLARRANRVIATDVAPTAVCRARVRCRSLDNVQITCDDVASYVPDPAPDLIVFSEIGYYFDAAELNGVVLKLAGVLQEPGEFVALHWLGYSDDHVLHGDEVHEILRSCLPLKWFRGERHEGFRIDSWKCA